MLNKLTFGIFFTASLLLTSGADAVSLQSPLKIEPISWWAGMHNPRLQLMLHGDKIGSLKVDIEGDDVTILETKRTDNPNYLFITLNLADAKAQTLALSLLDDQKVKYRVNYSLHERAKGSAMRQGFSNKDVIYLITPDRFVNGDLSNDNQIEMLEQINRNDKDGRHGGDIQGIENSLDYLEKLGVTQLWINPLLENNQQKYSYHGYSTTDHYRIDPRFGSNETYKELVRKANDKGIGIIQDIIVNHIGSNHWWMQDLPSSTWINGIHTNQDKQPINYTSHRRSTVQDPYAVSEDHSEFVDGWFVDTMPDLNQTDPLLATYLIQNSIWWVEYANLSGIREDTYSYADKVFLSDWSKAIMTEYPNFNIVGEEWTANPITVSYWQAGKINQDGYISYLPSLMDFPLYEVMLKALTQTESWDKGFISLYGMMANDVIYANPSNLVLFEGNHDTNRLYSLMNEDLNLFKMAMTYTLTSNRIPQLFYGTEVLMTSPKEGRHDGEVRSDFPGGWTTDKINALTGKGLTEKQRDAQEFVKTLLNFRKNSAAIHKGSLKHYVPIDGVYVYFRSFNDETLMVVMNKNDKPVQLTSKRFKAQLDGFSRATEILTDTQIAISSAEGASITVPARGVLLLSLTD